MSEKHEKKCLTTANSVTYKDHRNLRQVTECKKWNGFHLFRAVWKYLWGKGNKSLKDRKNTGLKNIRPAGNVDTINNSGLQ